MTGEQIQARFRESPFSSFLQLEVMKAQGDSLTVRMPLRDEIRRSAGVQQFHGGALATLADIAGDFAVALLVGGPVPTVRIDVDYLRPATGNWVEATATVRRQGRTLSTVDIELTREDGQLVALGRGTYVSVPG
jgi:uncharacterized protein (TIGR00369 family)